MLVLWKVAKEIMTHDHLETFIDAMEKEGVPFIVAVPHGKAECGFRIVSNVAGVTHDLADNERDAMEAHVHEYFEDWRQETDD